MREKPATRVVLNLSLTVCLLISHYGAFATAYIYLIGHQGAWGRFCAGGLPWGFWPVWTGAMHDLVCELRRTSLLGTSVNKLKARRSWEPRSRELQLYRAR